jgi:hypothetical protein
VALLTNRLNAQSYTSSAFAGGAEAWDIKRLRLLRNMYASQAGVDDRSGIPNGYNTGLMLLPLKAGGMSSFNPSILNLVNLDADAKMGKALEGSATLTITNIDAQADQIIPLIASDTLAAASSNAAMSAGVQAVASSTMSISDDAGLGGIIPTVAAASCSISPDVDMTAKAFIEATAGGPTPLSPGGLSQTLLDESDIETGYSMREALRLILASTAGKLSGAGTATITIRSVTDGTNRIVATVDSNGNRTDVTYNVGDE